MKAAVKPQKDFRVLNAGIMDAYEKEVKDYKKEEKQRKDAGARIADPKNKMFEAAGVDAAAIEKKQNRDAEIFLKKIAPIRKKYINRESQYEKELKSREFYTGLLAETKRPAILPSAASILSADAKHIEAIDGERSKVWVMPTDPSRIKIKNTGHIGGWTCGQAYAAAPDPTANIWFQFTPTTTGKWDFSAILAFHGFYVLRSDDSWYNCRSAWVKLSATVKVYQYNWQGQKSFTLLDKKESNSNYTRLFDSTEWLDTSAVVRAGDPVSILATVKVEAMSLGSGTYGELNFNDGNANYILPVLATASPA